MLSARSAKTQLRERGASISCLAGITNSAVRSDAGIPGSGELSWRELRGSGFRPLVHSWNFSSRSFAVGCLFPLHIK